MGRNRSAVARGWRFPRIHAEQRNGIEFNGGRRSQYSEDRLMARTLVPPAIKINGAALIPDGDNNPTRGDFWCLWVDWPYSTWFQPQIDNAAAVGCNATSILISHGMVRDSLISQATVISQLQTLVAYCKSKG